MRILNKDKLAAAINGHTDERLADCRLGGGEILVKQEGKTAYHRTFGVQHTGDTAPLQDNFIFRTASMTKPVTAVAVLREADQGRIDINKPIKYYLPEFARMRYADVVDRKLVDRGYADTPIRIYHLLSHTSGLGCIPENDQQSTEHMQGSLADVAEYNSRIYLAFDPYTSQAYSSAAFCVAARIVELTSGMDYKEYIKKYLFDPMDMPDTGYELTPAQQARMISMHCRTKEGTSVDRNLPTDHLFENLEPGQPRGGYGLASTAGDYSNFAEMLLHGGVAPSGERILSPESVQRMQTPHVAENVMPFFERWGLGVRVICRPDYPHGLEPGCFGWSGAYGSHFWVDPINKITAVYAKNDGSDGGAGCSTGNEFERDVTGALE